MIKTKHLGLIAIASTAFLFSGCVPVADPFYNNGYYNTTPRIATGLYSYSYPYYFNRPYYFYNGLYYYGGRYSQGYYYYGNRKFRRGHYYYRGNRYYNGRRYAARSGRYGYYKNRTEYQRAVRHRKTRKTRQRTLDNGRVYQRTNDNRTRPTRTIRTRNTDRSRRTDSTKVSRHEYVRDNRSAQRTRTTRTVRTRQKSYYR